MHKVFVNGIGKSGNNLLIRVCKLMGVQFDSFGLSGQSLIGKYNCIKRLIRGPKWEKAPINIGIDSSAKISSTWLNKKIKSLDCKSFTGHAAYSNHLISILHDNNIKIIQIIRDPRDVIVSFSHWIKSRPDHYAYKIYSSLPKEEIILNRILGSNSRSICVDSIATMMDRTYGWLTIPSDVLVVRFEDLVGINGGGNSKSQMDAIIKIAEWLDVKNKSLGEVQNQVFGNTMTFRKGQIGTWQNEFVQEAIIAFDDNVGPRLKLWGY